MNILNFESKLAGEYKFVVTKSDGTITESDWFDNLILDSGLNAFGFTNATSSIIGVCRVGTGTTTPISSQTILDAQIASANISTSYGTPVSIVNGGSSGSYKSLHTFTYAFAQGAVVGNISEVGIGWAASGATLFSRALILDSAGSPVSMSIVALDQLTIYYRIKITPPLTDNTGSITINGTVYNYTSRICSVASFASSTYLFNPVGGQGASASMNPTGYNGGIKMWGPGATLGIITSSGPSGSTSDTGFTSGATTLSIALGSYVAGTFYRDDVWTYNVNAGNFSGGIQALVFGYAGDTIKFQYLFDTPIPKTNTNVLKLTVRCSWGRG